MLQHQDILGELNNTLPIDKKLVAVHRVMKKRFEFIDRVAIVLYDPKTDTIKTFVDSSSDSSPLVRYEVRLSEAQSLRHIMETGQPRVVDDIATYTAAPHEHTQKIRNHGFRSSYTMPMYVNGNFFGFVFFNSFQKGVFSSEALHFMDVFGHLISLVVINEITQIHTMLAAVKSARLMTHHRDLETGAHLDRMSRYSQLIARNLAELHGFDDEAIEHIFLFAPLHDIGKIGIPDRILLKPGKLSEEEFSEMRTHAVKGREIIDSIIADFGLESLQHVDVLRNIAQFHHEALDGSGYPNGLRNEEIPIEARIVAVADIFDALTSDRPYKKAWNNDLAFDALLKLSGVKLDAACVEALINNRAAVEEIQSRFSEDCLG
ncbi:MAG: HD domain-containing protein [Sulfurimicrobium sp.]|jgi:HD-GYP domain-containing protein (c-di-GMP phosphodiesterase class II)|nr:HD domain-containing protein [Sulfurimicrobium sp.]